MPWWAPVRAHMHAPWSQQADESFASPTSAPSRAITHPPGIPISVAQVSGRGAHTAAAENITFDNTAACWRQLLLLLQQYNQKATRSV